MRASALPCAARLRRAARRGAASLSDEAQRGVSSYVNAQHGRDGGYLGRNGSADLYYSFFALACLEALGQPISWDRTAPYLASFGDGEALDVAHLSCLVRSRALAPGERSRAALTAARLSEFVALDGGFRPVRASRAGSIAASFAAQLAYEDLDGRLPVNAHIDDCIAARECADGSWADVPGLASGTTTVTAAVALKRAATGRGEARGADWLAERHARTGGFFSSPVAPLPDLLSTAAALVALAALEVPRATVAEPTCRFVESLWNDDGGFRGFEADTKSDCEFTYYALVALGALEDDHDEPR
jgi:hypothetical protein